jgi:3'-phosphoadenosine 5'-phosphosulfate sulfotransferase (PAPS reductase)/FAD synthetase
MFSGGKDSLLTLLLVMEQMKPEVVWYRTGSEKQRQVVEKWAMKYGLTVYSYDPSKIYYLPMEERPALVREFAINDATFPVVVETIDGTRCGLQLNEDRSDTFLYPYDVTFTGWKDSDVHELASGLVPYAKNGTVIGGSRFYAPIRHLDDDAVMACLRILAPEFEDFDDSLSLCTSCFASKDAEVFCPMEQTTIPTIPWNSQPGLEMFRKRFFTGG